MARRFAHAGGWGIRGELDEPPTELRHCTADGSCPSGLRCDAGLCYRAKEVVRAPETFMARGLVIVPGQRLNLEIELELRRQR